MKEVEDFILNNTSINHDDYVVMGISGGPDSMAILHVMIKLR